MKNIRRSIIMAAALVAGVLSGACNSDDDFTAGPRSEGAQIYFPTTAQTSYSLSDDENSIVVPVYRVETSEAQSFPVLGDDPSSLFSIPSTVSFAAGAEKAELIITFDRSKLEDGTEYPIMLLLNDTENTSPYGLSQISLSVTPWPWQELGKGLFRDDCFSSLGQLGNPEIEVTIHRHKSKEGVYLIEDMYGWNFLTEAFQDTQENLEASGIISYVPANITLDCSDPNKVILGNGWTSTGVTIMAGGQANFGLIHIGTLKDNYGKLENGVITFPKKGLAVKYDQEARFANVSGLFRIVLPGFEITDYSLAAKYAGMRVASDNKTTTAVFDFTFGADVTGVTYTFVAGDVETNFAAVAANVANGTDKNAASIENFPVGKGQVSIEASLSNNGVYTLVALPHDKAGQLRTADAAAVSFYFPGMGGEEIPECDIKVILKRVSEVAPDLVAKYPDHSTLFFGMFGTEIKSGKYLFAKTAAIEATKKDQDLTDAELIELAGTDFEALDIADINNEGLSSLFQQLDASTSYTLIVKAVNIYGKTKVETISCTTGDIDYRGELAIGKYVMSYAFATETGETATCTNTFEIMPQPNKTDEFFVRDFGLDQTGIDWYAKYDAAKSTLTLNGIWRKNEDRGSYLGKWVGISESDAILFFSYLPSEEQPTGKTPIEIVIDPTSKQPKGLNTSLEVAIGDIEGNAVTNSGLAAIYEAGKTTIVPASAATTSARMQGVRTTDIPFCSFGKAADTQIESYHVQLFPNFTRIETGTDVTAPASATLKVTSRRCEPLPASQTPRARFQAVAGLEVIR